MNFLGKVFSGGKKQEKAPTAVEAIQKLRETETTLYKKQEYLEEKIQSELSLAKKHGTKNKRAALQALKKKKTYEKQLTQLDGTLSTIEFQRVALENANTNTEVLKILGYAAKALKAAHQDMDAEQVHGLMDDIAEAHELTQEISDAISMPFFGNDVDEDELEKELENLEQDELDEKLLDVGHPSVDELPSVPATEPKRPEFATKHAKRTKTSEDDDGLQELAQWAS